MIDGRVYFRELADQVDRIRGSRSVHVWSMKMGETMHRCRAHEGSSTTKETSGGSR